MPSIGTPSANTAVRRARRLGLGGRGRAAGEDDRLGRERADRGVVRGARQDLGIHAGLAHPPRDQLGVLGAEVEDQDALGHGRRRPGCVSENGIRGGIVTPAPAAWRRAPCCRRACLRCSDPRRHRASARQRGQLVLRALPRRRVEQTRLPPERRDDFLTVGQRHDQLHIRARRLHGLHRFKLPVRNAHAASLRNAAWCRRAFSWNAATHGAACGAWRQRYSRPSRASRRRITRPAALSASARGHRGFSRCLALRAWSRLWCDPDGCACRRQGATLTAAAATPSVATSRGRASWRSRTG